jgi:hypothetical protein
MKNSSGDRRRFVSSCLRVAFLASATIWALCGARAGAQADASDAPNDSAIGGLPLRAPGYEFYYHNDSGPSAFANRWGYYDGWRDGRHDRQVGLSVDPKDEDKYKLAPDHGQHPGLDRDKYKSLYRTAYLHGYERGSKL